MKNIKVGRLVRCTAVIMFILMLLSCCVVGVFARYQTEIKGTGSAQTARFDVQVTDCPTELIVSEEFRSSSFEFDVKSNSEVDIAYYVVLTVPLQAVLPDDVTFSLSLNGNAINSTKSENVYTFTDTSLLKFTANDNNKHTLRLTVNATYFSRETIITDIRLDVVATQIQPEEGGYND